MAEPHPRFWRDYEQVDPFRSEYRSGHEPSAPPYSYDQDRYRNSGPPQHSPASPSSRYDEFPYSRDDGKSHHPPPQDSREPVLGRPEENETLGGYLFSRLLGPLWRGSHTVLRMDMRRSLAYQGPVFRKGRYQGSTPSGTVASSGGRDYADDEDAQGMRGWLGGLSGGGARFKLMQLWDAPPSLVGLGPGHNWNINVGFGLNLELDRGVLEPKFRLRANHLALHLIPEPEFELRGKWPLMGTKMGVSAKYRIPLTLSSLEDIWSSPGARLMVNFYSPLGSGFHFTTGGVEFDEHLIRLGDHTRLRIAASLQFPRKLPLEEGEQPIKLHVQRLGLKTVIQPGVTVYK